jgi:Putative prokaryotic signal transducing protein
MFCPVCKAEYRLGFTRCSDCDVDLVESLAEVTDIEQREADESAALAWTGNSSLDQDLVCRDLDEARIFYYRRKHDVNSGLITGRPLCAVLVHERDRDRAQDVIKNLEREFASYSRAKNAGEDRATAEPVVEEETALPDSSDSADDGRDAPDDITPDFNLEQATAEVWSGEQKEMAEMLQACLRENGVGCVIDDSGGSTRIRVVPESEARAREIIREVIEGTPPE